jgi:aminoglycoside phosphotransferase (APT) family kinase protein
VWQLRLADGSSVVVKVDPAGSAALRPLDGNVLGDRDGLTGLVDGERWLWGDPLVDFVSPALFRRIEDEPDRPFLAGHGPVVLDPRRLGLYRVHLALLMLVEMPGRGMVGPEWTGRRERVTRHLEAELAALR